MLNKVLLQSKLKASAIHFGVSLCIFALVFAWVSFVAYPSVYFTMAGAIQGLTLVFFVDVVLGPLLSFLVYNPKKPKKEIISDFAIIGAIQFAALSYGLYTLYQEHPSVIIVYPNSSSTVITHREMGDYAELGDLSQYSMLAGMPVAVLDDKSIKPQYLTLQEGLSIIQSTNIVTRKNIARQQDIQQELNGIDMQYATPYVIAVMAKYNGAYFVLSNDLQFITKFGEKPVS